jgi:tight adherence protein C
MIDQIIILSCSFGAVALITHFVVQLILSWGKEGKLRDRLATGAPGVTSHARHDLKLTELIYNIGRAAARPFMPTGAQKQVIIRRSLARAGIYSPSAIRLVAGAKFICLTGGLALGYVAGTYLDMGIFYLLLLGLPMGGLVGYLLPLLWLKLRTASNQRALTNGLADALDLMVVCVEAGLTIDAAMQRIGQELAQAHPAISRELGLTHMETRVGLPRSEAMRNMGRRCGNPALLSLASMLIQAERFGTSIADALRVHSDTLRINRHMAAEETAGKAAVKMSFPLVLCIFPATFIVLAGPTIIQLVQSSLFK